MKTKLTLISLMAFIHFLPAQNFVEYRPHSEATSIFRGNRTANLSIEIQRNAHIFGCGLDYIYANHSPNRSIDKDKLSSGGFFKYGYNPTFYKNNLPMFFGFYLRINSINYDTHYQDREAPGDPYFQANVGVGKLIPMLYFQYNYYPFEHIFLGMQVATGFPLLLVGDPHDLEKLAPDYQPAPEDNLRKLHIYEFGVFDDVLHKTWGPTCQLNVLVGLRF